MVNQSNQNAKAPLSDHVSLGMIAKGILVSYIITIPIFIVFAIVLTYTNFPEKLISPAVIITTVISITVAGSTATRRLKNKGWLNGCIVGLIYMLVLYILSSLVFGTFSIDSRIITLVIIAVIAGATGGIIGINVKRNIHYKNR